MKLFLYITIDKNSMHQDSVLIWREEPTRSKYGQWYHPKSNMCLFYWSRKTFTSYFCEEFLPLKGEMSILEISASQIITPKNLTEKKGSKCQD